jgi:EAL domain-containing protein (putative c-di-GMP-specific phosphodiesterase class I)/GGDEF domain-containing protein
MRSGNLKKLPACDCTGSAVLEMKLRNRLDQNLDDELHRQMLAYGQRYDIQTGLLNYQSFQESLAALLRNAEPGQEFALVWIDLLNLRREFSLWGSKGAESLVRHVSSSLRGAADADSLLGRFGARCFLAVMSASKFDRGDRARIQTLVNALEPLRAPGSEIKPEIAAGVAFYPSDTDSAEDLVRFSSLAAAGAGHSNSTTVIAFNAGMNSLIMRDHRLEVEMHKGLDQGQFCTFYQPKVSLTTGEVLGAEALTRWTHPEWGPVAPSEFIPIAERSRLIHRIFDFSLRSALKDAQRWRDMGLTLPIVSVNASAANVLTEGFVSNVRAMLAEIPIAPTVLEIEVTESMLFDDEDLFTHVVRELQDAGVRIVIDDFGTRYTGFNVLKKLTLNAMKIDRCFIHGIDRSQDMRAMCQTIVAMGRQLKMRTVAEGIEEPGELAVMREIGCDAGQGYLFQRPMPAEAVPAFLREWPERSRIFGFVASGNRSTIDTMPKMA